jgi:hypothetical protein
MRTSSNVGTYVAKNAAMTEARGAYITFHDSDDWAHPDRIAHHVQAMERNPDVVATRSEWLRVDTTGEIQFRRWGRKFQHPNPASIFIRKQVIDELGYFDSVRYGADSEFWFRLGRFYGRRKVRTLQLCLGLGRLHGESLTRSGSGAMGDENYSPVRGAYAASYLSWHAKSAKDELKLPPLSTERPFAAPRQMTVGIVPENDIRGQDLPNGHETALSASKPVPARPTALKPTNTPLVVFGISLASKRASANWARTQELLQHTLRSLLHQSDPRFLIAIGGHEKPDLPELQDSRVQFITCDAPPPEKPSGFRRDKRRKRRLVGNVLRSHGGGYFFPLDADDLVHCDLVAHVLLDNNQRGYLIESGYAFDYNNGRVAPIPGAWPFSFDRVCGSSAVLYFRESELPLAGDNDERLYFNAFESHAYWPITAYESERALDTLPFPGAVYVLNHSQNLSFKLQRGSVRTQNIIDAVARNALQEGTQVLQRDFGWRSPGRQSASAFGSVAPGNVAGC